MSGLYLYALVDEEPAHPLGHGLAGEVLRLVRSGEVLAVAGEREAKPAPGVHAFSHHDGIVRRLAGQVPALLPARFGEWFPDEATLLAKLAPRAGELGEALELVRGSVQMTLRVFGEAAAPPPGSVVEESGLGPGSRYLAERRREQERARALPEIDPLRELLAPHLRAEKTERRGTPPLLGTAYHLVLRGHLAGYRAALERGCGELSVNVQPSGPWPPYAFAPGAAP